MRGSDPAAPAGPQLTRVLEDCLQHFPLAAAAIRDTRDAVVAASGAAERHSRIPGETLGPDSLGPAADGTGGADWTCVIPEAGGRIPLLAGANTVGWLDAWGNGAAMGPDDRRALIDLARLVAVLMATITPAAR